MKNKTMKLFLAAALSASMLMSAPAVFAAETETEAAAEDDENYMTGDAEPDKEQNERLCAAPDTKKEILVLSFGTSYNYSRYMTVGGVERALEDAFTDDGWCVRRGFTANIIIDHVERRDGYHIDDYKEALQKAVDAGVEELVVVPTHLMAGHEYNDVLDAVTEVAGDAIPSIAISDPLFGQNDALNFDPVVPVLHDIMENYNDGETAIVYMGHGTDADSDADYGALQDAFDATEGCENYYVTTVESATWNTQRVIDAIKDKGYTKVVLHPLMVVAGDHAHNDMAGLDEDSIRSQFEAAGYEVDCVLDGLGQNDEIQQLYVDHAQAAIDSLAE